MLRNKKEGPYSGARRTAHRRFLPVFLIIILLIPLHNVDAAGQNMSGTIQLGNTLNHGNTAYSVEYSYPSSAQVGTNLTISITLLVTSLTGLAEYIRGYEITVSVAVGTLPPLSGFLGSNGTALSGFLYPGSSWGPFTVSIPLTADNTGIAKGQSANATVSVNLEDRVYYGFYDAYETEPPMVGLAGSLVIQNAVTSVSTSTTVGGTGQSYLPYALLASGAVLMLFAVVLPRVARPPQANQK